MQKISFSLWPLFLFFLTALLAFGGISPLPFGYVIPVLGLGFFIAARVTTKQWPKLDWPLYGWVLALTLLSAASSLWSITPEESLERSLKVSALLLFSLPLIDLARICPPETLKKWCLLIPAASFLAGIYPLIELSFGFPLYRLYTAEIPKDVVWGSIMNKGVSIFIMSLPAALLICHRMGTYTVSILLLLVAVLLAGITESQASQLALLVIPLAWCGLFILPGAGIPAAFGLAAVILLLMPWFSPLAFDIFAADLAKEDSLAQQASASMRLENWDFISRKIMENPWTGFGMDATRSINDFQSEKLYFATNTIMHPHNLALQLWIEFGIAGILLILGFFGFLALRLLKLPPSDRRTPFTIFCVTLTFLLISWSIWASWLLGFIVYLGVLTILALRTSNVRATS